MTMSPKGGNLAVVPPDNFVSAQEDSFFKALDLSPLDVGDDANQPPIYEVYKK